MLTALFLTFTYLGTPSTILLEEPLEFTAAPGLNRQLVFDNPRLRHPEKEDLMMTAVFDEKDPRGEVDGVWVAEDDLGEDPDPENC